jgi:hypothetical protein
VIRVAFDPTELTGEQATWWERWEARSCQATTDLKNGYSTDTPPKYKSAVWAVLREWLFENVFAKKCAYCEGKAEPQSFVHAEHWRPKSAVTQQRNEKCETVKQGGKPHPGYWWLAYDWINLLPACQQCNSGNGKGTQFPVAGEHVFEPFEGETADRLDESERPLLLHPLRGPDPGDHLAFNELGEAFAVDDSQLGRASISVFDLNRGGLVEDRFERLHQAESEFLKAALTVATSKSDFSDALGYLHRQSAEYSAAIRQHSERWIEDFVDRMRR